MGDVTEEFLEDEEKIEARSSRSDEQSENAQSDADHRILIHIDGCIGDQEDKQTEDEFDE